MALHVAGYWCNPRDPGYGLEANDVPVISRSIVGIPLTYEHSGIVEAASTAAQKNNGIIDKRGVERALECASGKNRPVGKVVAADSSGRFIAKLNKGMPLTEEAITNGKFAVSLSHVGSTKTPLELSLTVDPARQDASIVAQYKGDTLPLDKAAHLLSMTDSTPAQPMATEAVSTLEAALASVTDPEARKRLEEQLAKYQLESEASCAKLSELETKLGTMENETKARTETEQQIVRDMAQQLFDTAMARDPDASLPLGRPKLEGFGNGFSPAALHETRQLLEVCSRAMAVKQPQPQEPVAAQAPTEEPANKRTRAAPGSSTSQDALIRALHRSFD